MIVVFLPSATRGLRWFHRYYTEIFPEGIGNAERQFAAMKLALVRAPMIGRPNGSKDARLWSMPRTPFSVIYRLRDERVEIMHVHDGRAERSPKI